MQRSFTNDDAGSSRPHSHLPTAFLSAPIRRSEGARPFRRAPHTGFFTATYADKRITGFFTSAFASRSDDSTYLEGEDANGGNSLLLPNRNLDYGYAKLDLGGSYQLFTLARRLRAGRKSARQPAHRAHRLSQPALHASRRPPPSLGPRQWTLRPAAADSVLLRTVPVRLIARSTMSLSRRSVAARMRLLHRASRRRIVRELAPFSTS